jgi:hypothetical protein
MTKLYVSLTNKTTLIITIYTYNNIIFVPLYFQQFINPPPPPFLSLSRIFSKE